MAKLEDTNPKISKDNARIEDLFDVFQWKNKWVAIRLLDLEMLPIRQHWIDIISSKQRKEVRIPKICVAFNPETGEDIPGVKCPYCEINDPGEFFLANAIVRPIQEDKPSKLKRPTKEEKKTGFKDKNSDSWTPVRVIRLTGNVVEKIKSLKDLNKRDGKKYSVTHPKYGADINIKYNEKGTGADKYQVTAGDKSRLSEEEQEYLVYELPASTADALGRETLKEAKKQIERMELNDKGDEEPPRKKGKRSADSDEDTSDFDKPKRGKKAAASDSDEDSDSDKPKKGKKGSKKAASDSDDTSDSDKPKKGKKGSKKAASDSDEDSDDTSDSDKPKKGKKKAYDSDADDSSDSDEDSDKPKKGKKGSKKVDSDEDETSDSDKPKKRGKKKVDSDSDDASDSDKPKKGKKASKKADSDEDSDSDKSKKRGKRSKKDDSSDSDSDIPF